MIGFKGAVWGIYREHIGLRVEGYIGSILG